MTNLHIIYRLFALLLHNVYIHRKLIKYSIKNNKSIKYQNALKLKIIRCSPLTNYQITNLLSL